MTINPGSKRRVGFSKPLIEKTFWVLAFAAVLAIPAQASGPPAAEPAQAERTVTSDLWEEAPTIFTQPGGPTVLGECNPFEAPLKTAANASVTITTILDGTAEPPNPTYISSTGVQVGRITRDSNPSVCGTPKPNPGLWTPTGDRQYDSYRFVALGDGCATVTLRDTGDYVVHAVAYDSAGINPSDPTANYLADIGSSPPVGGASTMGFDVVVGQMFYVVVHEVDPGGGFGTSYTLELNGVKIVPDFSVQTTMDNTLAPMSPAYYGLVGIQTGRLTRDGVASTCQAPKANPGLFTSADNRFYDLYRFTPVGSGCMLVGLSQTTQATTGQEHAITYDENGFIPSDPSLNYLADIGSSSLLNTRLYSFFVEPGVPFNLVVHEVNPGTSSGDDYILNLSNVEVYAKIGIESTLDTVAPPVGGVYTSTTGLQTGRINRFSPVATCDEPKAFPGMFTSAGTRRYDVYTFTPPASGCVEVSLSTLTGEWIYAAAYDNNGFVPSSPGTNYLADNGNSPIPDVPSTFSFLVSGGVPFSVVVHEVDPGGATGGDYKLVVGGHVFWASAVPFFYDGFESGDTSAWN